MEPGLGLWRIGVGVLAVAAVATIAQRGRLFYRDRRPTLAGKALNRWWARAYGSGLLPSSLVSLETVGRRTGLSRANALVAADYDGQRYLVSMLGERSEWVRNVRASQGEAAIRRRRRSLIRLEEVPVGTRAPILKAYLSRARGARRHFNVFPDAPLESFEAVAANYPVFRIAAGSGAAQPAEPSVA